MEPSMKITEIKPYAVIERFPEHEETIKQLFKNEYNFKLLCSDYRRCFKALEFWSKSDLSEARPGLGDKVYGSLEHAVRQIVV